jgi:thaumarchaeosortase
MWLAYGLGGLKSFSISLFLLAGMRVIYLVDTIMPYGTFRPMQLLAIPTATFATGLLDILGYNVTLTYPVSSSEYGSLLLMTVSAGGETVRASVAWPCAGVHSLLLFTLITIVFFKRTTIQRDRKIIFFLVGAAGTYLTNIFRIASFFTISVRYGSDAGSLSQLLWRIILHRLDAGILRNHDCHSIRRN